jgi:MFS family permease
MEDNQSGIYYGYIVVAFIFVIMMMIWGTYATFGVFFASFVDEFGWTRAITSGAPSLRELIFGLACILSARLSEKYGPRAVVTICGFLLGLGYYFMSQVSAVWQLYLFFGGIIACGMSAYITVVSIVAKWFHRRRSTMTAIVFSGMGIGFMIIPPIANQLISKYGWRTSYMIIAVGSFILIPLAAQFLKPYPTEKYRSRETETVSTDFTVVASVTELSLKEAVSTGQFWLISFLYFFFLYMALTVVVHIVIHANGIGISSTDATNILAILGFLSVLGMPVAGNAAYRKGNKQVMTVNFLLMAVSFLWLLVAERVWSLYLFAVIFGIAYGGIQILFSPLVAQLFGLGKHSVILGTAAFAGNMGGALGPFVAGFVFDVTKSYNLVFFFCAILSTAGMIVSLFLQPVRKKSM